MLDAAPGKAERGERRAERASPTNPGSQNPARDAALHRREIEDSPSSRDTRAESPEPDGKYRFRCRLLCFRFSAGSPLSTLRSRLSALDSPLSTLRSRLSALNSPLSTLRSRLSAFFWLSTLDSPLWTLCGLSALDAFGSPLSALRGLSALESGIRQPSIRPYSLLATPYSLRLEPMDGIHGIRFQPPCRNSAKTVCTKPGP
jgi:hypothetical protein